MHHSPVIITGFYMCSCYTKCVVNTGSTCVVVIHCVL